MTEMIEVGIAAGMIKSASEFNRYPGLVDQVGSVTFGSFTNDFKVGNKEPTFWYDEETGNSVNAVGLTNNGLEWFLTENLPDLVRIFGATEGACKLRISLAPLETGDLGRMSFLLSTCAWRGAIAEAEINSACPNHRGEHGLKPVLAHDPAAVEILLKETQSLDMSKALKIAPETDEATLIEIVRLCIEHGVGRIVSANTKAGSSVIKGEQRLSVETGGHAGTCLLEPGVAQVKLLRRILADHFPTARMHITGCGGVMTSSAARQYIDAGADDVQVGTLFKRFEQRGLQDLLLQLSPEDA